MIRSTINGLDFQLSNLIHASIVLMDGEANISAAGISGDHCHVVFTRFGGVQNWYGPCDATEAVKVLGRLANVPLPDRDNVRLKLLQTPPRFEHIRPDALYLGRWDFYANPQDQGVPYDLWVERQGDDLLYVARWGNRHDDYTDNLKEPGYKAITVAMSRARSLYGLTPATAVA